MASHLIASLLFAFVLFFVSSNGRSLRTNQTSQNIDLLHYSFSNNATIRDFSFATDSYTGKTNYNDVLGLVALCTQFTWLLEANDDPCLPPTWSWIRCDSDANPRILELDLSTKILIGMLPDFSSMDALQIIDLSSNSLYGAIPSFLGTFPDLQELNLANNLFTGLVPNSLACNKKLKLSVDGNSNIYTSGSCSKSNNFPSSPANTNIVNTNTANTNTANTNTADTGIIVQSPTKSSKKKSKRPIIIGSTTSAFGVLWIAFGVFAIFRHKAKTAAAVAEASAPPGPGIAIPTEEMPMNAGSNNMSP